MIRTPSLPTEMESRNRHAYGPARKPEPFVTYITSINKFGFFLLFHDLFQYWNGHLTFIDMVLKGD